MAFLTNLMAHKKLKTGGDHMCKTLTPDLKAKQLRQTLGQFPTGVAVVTTLANDGAPVGMTINSFSSISLNPALVGWCIDRRSLSYEVFAATDRFAITVLSESQTDLARRFASRGGDKFRDIKLASGECPVIADGSAWFQCRTFNRFLLGDHLMLVGRVEESDACQRLPLVFAQGNFTQLYPESSGPQSLTA